MTKEDNYNMSDFIQEEVAVRDYLLRKTHAAPDVSGELDSFLAKMTEDGKIREEISEVMSGDNLSDDMDLEKRSLVRRFAIPAILAMAASIALVLFLYFGKKHHHWMCRKGLWWHTRLRLKTHSQVLLCKRVMKSR